ncbi:hypothetical protein ACPCIY_25970 [Streptomyces thermodiastaticus]
MKSLTGTIVAITAFFVLVILLLGSQFGGVEITVWLAALIASLVFAVRHHRRNKNQEGSHTTSE